MPKPTLQAVPETKPEVTLSVELRASVRARLKAFVDAKAEVDAATEKYAKAKVKIEEAFAEHGEHALLRDGVRVSIPYKGEATEIPLKMIGGFSSSFDWKGFMKKFGITQKDKDKFTKKKPKKEYLGIFLPKESKSHDDEDDE